MKSCFVSLALILAITGFAADTVQTFTSLDKPSGEAQEPLPPGTLDFDDAGLDDVLHAYQKFSRRTVVRPAALPANTFKLRSETALTRIQILQMLDTALAQNGVTMVPQGNEIVKAVPAAAAAQEAVPICELPAEELPESASYTCYIVELNHRKPRDLAQSLQPFAKLPNSILAIDDGGLLIIRDYSVNVKRMLQVVERLDKAPKKDDAAQ
jgi:general secretion pathway protein D